MLKIPLVKNVLLADDDADDRLLFEDALKQVAGQVQLTTAKDGQELMQILTTGVAPAPGVIFLDLNMPLKNGFECLEEIKSSEKLKDIPIVVFSTAMEQIYVNRVYEKGADYYISKPGSFSQLKKAIEHIISIDWSAHKGQPSRDEFLLIF